MDDNKYELTGKVKPSDNIESSISGPDDVVYNTYWRGFEELYNDPDFLEAQKNEFSKQASGDFNLSKLPAISRRKFLALMGASAALAAAGCSDYRDKGEIVPYNNKPEDIVLGIPNFYASTCTGCNNACGILVKAREGRPIKIDGNPDHPVNKGKICSKGQASILNLYDPDRLKNPVFSSTARDHKPISWQDADEKIISSLKQSASSGKEIAILTHTILSPTAKKLLDEFQSAYPTAKIYSYELFNDTQRKNAWMKCYGKGAFPVIDWDKAKIILALESDLLGNEGSIMEQRRIFAQNRDVMRDNEFNRLYSVEGAATLTGFNADYRIRLRTDAIEEFILCLLNEFIIKQKLSKYFGDTKLTSFLQKYSLSEFEAKYFLDNKIIKHLIDDLQKNQSSSIVVAGNKLPESTHIAVNLLNEVLNNTKLYSSEVSNVELSTLSSKTELETLISGMQSGKIDAVIHFDVNPVYHLSPDYNYTDALGKVPLVVSMVERLNETSNYSHYNLPINHTLESWGDYKTRTGFYSTQQPLIAPLYITRQKEAILLTWLKGKDTYSEKIYLDYLKNNWEKNIYPAFSTKLDFKRFWNTILHDGVALINEKAESIPSFSIDTFLNSSGKMLATNDYVALLQDNHNVGDGRFANNGWLQELPHPISKIVWDNYAAISLQTATDLSLTNDDMIEVTIGNKKQVFPVFIQPGVADKVVEIQLGYGRTGSGIVESGIGINANILMQKNAILADRLYNSAKISKAAGKYELITTQVHTPIVETPLLKDIQFTRGIIHEGTYEQYKRDPEFLIKQKEKIDLQSVNKEHEYNLIKWGMSIDMNKCIGCGACTAACNVENNIAVVGKDQVKVSREMHWMRIDRYYYGSPDSPRANFQPMLCQQCDFAPCENVCPVAATTHSPDGLNQMTYNRCVGTRYCSNNCPYKVRRFNYFNFRDHFKDGFYDQESVDLVYNPEVTVRSRGVMEKCTFCIQRIMDERQKAIEQNRNVIGSNVKTACQDACPSYAIVFGDTNDKESEVSKYREHEIGYYVLESVKTKPNVTYLAKLRNIYEEIKMEKSL